MLTTLLLGVLYVAVVTTATLWLVRRLAIERARIEALTELVELTGPGDMSDEDRERLRRRLDEIAAMGAVA
jgi:hypothetical protein